jgi:hypothetical protein
MNTHPRELAEMLAGRTTDRLQVFDREADNRSLQHLTADDIEQLRSRERWISAPEPCRCRRCR